MASERMAPADRRGVLLVCLAVFGLTTGQQMVNPILAPLARELGFSELHLGAVMAVGASGVVLASPFWGRRSMTWGHRPVLLVSLVGALVGLAGFAAVARLGISGMLAVPTLFVLILLSRGLVFGLAWAANPVTAQSYIADITSGEAERVRGMAWFGAAQGLGVALGPALGGVLVFVDLLAPIYVAPLILAGIAVAVWFGLPRPAAHRERQPAAKVSPFDSRLWPFLLTGFGLFLAFAIVMMTLGFLIQDRLHLDARQTGQQTGLIMLAGAGLMMLVQAVVVPRLGWRAVRLIQAGTALMTVGMVMLAFAASALSLAAAMAVLGAGLGFAMPGFMSAPTLLVSRQEQGSVAGLVGSSNALAFMLAPLLGTALYERAPITPYVAASVLLLGLVVFVLTHPALRQSAERDPHPLPTRQSERVG